VQLSPAGCRDLFFATEDAIAAPAAVREKNQKVETRASRAL
jgi:hypothetical protein